MDASPREAFSLDRKGLSRAIELLVQDVESGAELPASAPIDGLGAIRALDSLASLFVAGSRDLGGPGFFAHMDPPTPWITWAAQMWAARFNQNLLHPDTAPVARDIEARVIDWLAPFFGMSGGHFTPGSSVANLTALWAARESGATEVVSGAHAHLSVAKAAHILGMPHRTIGDWSRPGDIGGAVAVITAGTTSSGEIEPLDAALDAAWRHVDAAWSGPLRISPTHRHLLDGIEAANSVAVSAHKWLFQPKESALVLFADVESAHRMITAGGAYLTVPNVGVLGSHGASALPLAATLLAYGTSGVASWIDSTMELAETLWQLVDEHPDLHTRSRPQSGVVNWRHRRVPVDAIIASLPDDVLVSSTVIAAEAWLRSVAANPMADVHKVVDGVLAAAESAR